ncbi:MAG: peptidylprolyl isomerase [Alcaligenaceae bacterium]|nr:MAG: peptidylprolyl isomerase [Alcaligenaceae bacterium]
MFDFIRNQQRWMQLILLLLILPSFAFFGVQGYSSFISNEPELASVDGKGITLGEFNNARRAQLEQYRTMLGAQFDVAAFDTPAFREQLLNTLIDQRAIAIAATNGAYSVSDETLRRSIAAIPAVQQDGQFSPERYKQVLAAQGMTTAAFEQGLRRDLTLAQVLQPIGSTARVPAEIGQKIFALITEQRTVARKLFSLESFAKDVSVADTEIKAWYDANQAKLMVTENVDIDYVVLNEDTASKDLKISEADIESFYKQNEARYGQPERLRVSHILLEVAASADASAKAAVQQKAADLAKRATANPKDFASLAKEFSQDSGSASQGGDLGWVSKNMLVPQVEEALFKLKKDEVSSVVESPFGLHVLYVADTQPPSIKPLAEVKEDITVEIRKQLAAERFAAMAGKLTNLIYDQRDSLKPIADALGIEIKKATGLTREGLLPASQRNDGAIPTEAEQTLLGNPKVRQTAFSAEVLKDKLNSGAIELATDTILALRVTAVHAAKVPPLEQVAAQIRTTLTNERALATATDAGVKQLDLLKAATASEPKDFDSVQVVTRQSPQSLSREQLEAVMSASATPLPRFLGVAGPEGYAVLWLSKIEPGAAPEAAQVTQLQVQLSQAWGAAEEQAALKLLRESYKVKLTPDAKKLISGELDGAKL